MAELHRATPELVALAHAARPDWREHAVRAVIAEAAAVGWTWPAVLVALPRLMCDPEAVPGDLIPYQRNGQPALPQRQAEHAARIRADLTGRTEGGE